jgi:hypothetical protein
VPADDRLGFHDGQYVSPTGPGLTQGHPEDPILRLELGSRLRPREHRDLLAKGQVLENQVRAGTAEGAETVEKEGQHEV